VCVDARVSRRNPHTESQYPLKQKHHHTTNPTQAHTYNRVHPTCFPFAAAFAIRNGPFRMTHSTIPKHTRTLTFCSLTFLCIIWLLQVWIPRLQMQLSLQVRVGCVLCVLPAFMTPTVCYSPAVRRPHGVAHRGLQTCPCGKRIPWPVFFGRFLHPAAQRGGG
jgi:hypothetical protein